MGLTRRGKGRRDSNEAEIVAALRMHGCSVVHLDDPADLLVGRDGRTFLLEVKTAKGKLGGPQILFAQKWRGQYAVVRSPTDALKVVLSCD